MPNQTIPFRERVFEIVRQIPAGQVTTYGRIARLLGAGTARMVGMALASLPPNTQVPWHRVINAQGRISPRGIGNDSAEQRRLLEQEQVRFDANGRTDLTTYLWRESA
jgi:methylated-DNA-protein-cysteine methyltransferase-like protein